MSKLLITGSQGLVGSALDDVLKDNGRGYDIILSSRQDTDLTIQKNVKELFEQHRPDYVINTAASVSVLGNANCHADHYLNNILINTFIIDCCHIYDVKKVLNMSSTCIFPKDYEIFNESQMHDGPPFEAHYAYAYSKRMMDIQCKAYESQFGRTNYSNIIPGAIFGPNDIFNIATGHVIPSLLLKFFLANQNNSSVEIWGNGTAKREFIYSYDLANIMLDILDLTVIPRNILVCSDTELTIKALVSVIAEETNFQNEIVWNFDKPNGQMRKKSDTSLLKQLLPNLKFTDFRYAIRDTYSWLEKHYPNIRINANRKCENNYAL